MVSNTKWPVERLLRVREEEVLTQRKTDLGPLDETLARHHELPIANRADARLRRNHELGRISLHPRHGETLVDGQVKAMIALRDGTADLVSILTDPYTRQLRFDDAARALSESVEAGRSLISGYPVVSHGVAVTREIVDAVQCPVSVRMASADSRLSKELYLASGATYAFMGPMQNLAYEKYATPEELIEHYQYEDRLVGLLEENGCPVVKELPATLTGTLVPPCIVLSSTIIDALLAVEQGVRRVVCSYGLLGNLIQDVAAVHALRQVAPAMIAEIADDVEFYVDVAQWMGDFPQDEGDALGIVVTGAIAGALGGADEIITKSIDEAFGVPTLEANVAGVRATRQAVDACAGQAFESSPELDAEVDVIRRSVEAILARTLELGHGDLARGASAAIRAGVFDVPFSPSLHNAGRATPVRDLAGRVRWLDPGNIPLPDDIRAFHAERVSGRAAVATKPGYQMVVEDVLGFSRGLEASRTQRVDDVDPAATKARDPASPRS
ncbi:MAG TPA: methylaspartate mutase subunit E [Solirubrobacteraceae bacterium]|jgi:methylaspartate mutase epsilon subunit